MKVGMALFILGLILLMSGIFLSAYWAIAGSFMGIFGGMMMGSSSYFLAKTGQKAVKK
jgi:membrane-bound ClpP family serine protease